MNTTLQIGYGTLALEYVQTREQWLERAATMMRESLIPQLEAHRCRVSCGWPHKAAVARTARRVGECWYPEHSTDRQSHNLFISPALQDPLEVLETLAHELIHVVAGLNVGHKGQFVKIAKAIGFKAPWTSTPATPGLIERLNWLLVNLGPYPHAAIDRRGRKKQGTRLLKVVCGACGYTIRPRSSGLIPGCRLVPAVQKWSLAIKRGGRAHGRNQHRTAARLMANAQSGFYSLGPLRRVRLLSK